MVWGNDYSDNYNQYQDQPKHESKISHELIAGAAAYEAAKAYEGHVAANGRPDSHAKAKEIAYGLFISVDTICAHRPHSAGFAGAFVDKEFETHGLNFIDKEKAKYEGRR
ncbi:hypothetical protein BJV74DRAFT_838123 [Russula compacta]|nr:hypothetical protein BJV74DRAFT_838123 [Russula compacta]